MVHSPGGSNQLNGVLQKLVDETGCPGGMKVVLQDASKMRETLAKFPDFRNPKTLLEELMERRGHIRMFSQSFIVNLMRLNSAGAMKRKHTRQYANGSIVRLRKIAPEAMNTSTPDLIYKTCRDYMRAYRGGYDCTNVDATVKVQKSHRRVSNADN